MIEALLFNLEVILYHKGSTQSYATTVMECPAKEQVERLYEYTVPGFFITVSCTPVRGRAM